MATLQELADFIKATGAHVEVTVLYDLCEKPEPSAPADPGQPSLIYYRIDASSKKSGQVKVRQTPSPSSDGPTIAHNTRVAGTTRGQTNNGIFFLEILTLDEMPLRGWVEDFYLIPE